MDTKNRFETLRIGEVSIGFTVSNRIIGNSAGILYLAGIWNKLQFQQKEIINTIMSQR